MAKVLHGVKFSAKLTTGDSGAGIAQLCHVNGSQHTDFSNFRTLWLGTILVALLLILIEVNLLLPYGRELTIFLVYQANRTLRSCSLDCCRSIQLIVKAH